MLERWKIKINFEKFGLKEKDFLESLKILTEVATIIISSVKALENSWQVFEDYKMLRPSPRSGWPITFSFLFLFIELNILSSYLNDLRLFSFSRRLFLLYGLTEYILTLSSVYFKS